MRSSSSPSSFHYYPRFECKKPTRVSFERSDPYGILGVDKGFSELEIKRAYRNLVKKYHPDVAPAGKSVDYEKRFVELHQAYSVLKDHAKGDRFAIERVHCHYRSESLRMGRWRVNNWETDQCW